MPADDEDSRLEKLEQKNRTKRNKVALQTLETALEKLRQGLLDYDAAEDKRGEKWDDRRIVVDKMLRDGIRLLQLVREDL